MNTYSLEDRPYDPWGLGPHDLRTMRKTVTIDAVFLTEPFFVDTQEGLMEISPETTDDWDGGYWIAYPSDGSKPYAISPQFIRDNYVEV